MSPHFAWANCFLTNSSRRTCSFAFCMNNLSFISNPFLVRKVFENPIELVFLKTLSSLLYFFFLHLCLTGLLGFLNVLLQLFLLFFYSIKIPLKILFFFFHLSIYIALFSKLLFYFLFLNHVLWLLA